jgi:hypothetical protein
MGIFMGIYSWGIFMGILTSGKLTTGIFMGI